jgi:uncharacterized protein
VPVLLSLFPEAQPAEVTAISLTVVFFNAYAGTWAYARMKRIDYSAGLLLALAGVPGGLLGAWAVQFIPRGSFDLAFGLLLFLLGLYLVVQPTRSSVGALERLSAKAFDAAHIPDSTSIDWRGRSLVAAVGSAYLGVLSSLLGIGGGILHVPFLVRVLGFTPHRATATSQFVLALVTFFAALSHLLRGELDSRLGPTAFLALGVMMGAPLGAAISSLLRGPLLVRLLALALAVVAARLLWAQWTA